MRRFKLSLVGHFFILLAIAALAALGVFLGIHGSALRELALMLLSVWSLLTSFFWVILCSGIRLDKRGADWRLPILVEDRKPSSLAFFEEGLSNAFEMVCSMALTLLGGLLVGVLVWAKASFEVIGFITFFFVAYWIFRRGMKMVLMNLGKCQGEYLRAFAVAAAYSISYALVFGAIVYATENAVSNL